MARTTRKKAVKKAPARKKAVRPLNKTAITNELGVMLEDSGVLPEGVRPNRVVKQVLDDLSGLIENCMSPKSLGTFMLPGIVKFVTKERPAIRKGTMVRSPATGGMVPSKGRPKSLLVKARPLARIKQAAQK